MVWLMKSVASEGTDRVDGSEGSTTACLNVLEAEAKNEEKFSEKGNKTFQLLKLHQ